MLLFNSNIFCSHTVHISNVSILVLLDVALQPNIRTIIYLLPKKGFNPCFTGCCSSTLELSTKRYLWIVSVSILVLLDVALQPSIRFYLTFLLVIGFQSLFYWMLLFNVRRFKIILCRREVSILVLLDVALQLEMSKARLERTKCFNPCFTGCCSSTLFILKCGFEL